MYRHLEASPMDIKLNDQVEQREIVEGDADYDIGNDEKISEKDIVIEEKGEEDNKYEGYEEYEEDEEIDDGEE